MCYGGCTECADEYDEMCDCCGVRKKYKLGKYSKNSQKAAAKVQEPANDIEMANSKEASNDNEQSEEEEA
jgi:hypothetical protein